MCVWMYVCKIIRIILHIKKYVHMYLCMYVCIYISKIVHIKNVCMYVCLYVCKADSKSLPTQELTLFIKVLAAILRGCAIIMRHRVLFSNASSYRITCHTYIHTYSTYVYRWALTKWMYVCTTLPEFDLTFHIQSRRGWWSRGPSSPYI